VTNECGMDKLLSRFSLWTMAFFATGVALYSMRFELGLFNIWLGVDEAIHGVFLRVPISMFTHVLVAPVALLLGPFQFLPQLRNRHPAFHRWNGRIYVFAVLVAGTGALSAAPFASGGPVAGVGFGLLALFWLGTTFFGWRAAVARKFQRHRLLMRFSYALTFAAVTLRIQIPLGLIFLHFASYRELSVWLAYTCWIPNLIAVPLYTAFVSYRTRAAPSPTRTTT